jgi:hypothetical protein
MFMRCLFASTWYCCERSLCVAQRQSPEGRVRAQEPHQPEHSAPPTTLVVSLHFPPVRCGGLCRCPFLLFPLLLCRPVWSAGRDAPLQCCCCLWHTADTHRTSS